MELTTPNIKKKPNPLIYRVSQILVLLFTICIFVIIIFRFVVPFGLNLFWGKDIAPVNDSAMQLSLVQIPEQENAFYDLIKIKDVIDLKNVPSGVNFTSDFLNSDTWDINQLESLLNDNKLALQYFSDAASKQRFQSPGTADPNNISDEIIALNAWRLAAKLNSVKATWLFKNNHEEEALAELIKILKVGDMIEKSQIDLMTYLVSLNVKSIAFDSWQKSTSNLKINEQVLNIYKNELPNYALSDNISPWVFEYLLRKKTILSLVDGSYDLSETSIPENITLKTNYYFKPNLSINESLVYYNNIIDSAKKPCAIDEKKIKTDYIKQVPIFKWYFTENAIIKILLSTSDLAYQGLLANKCKIETKYLQIIAE